MSKGEKPSEIILSNKNEAFLVEHVDWIEPVFSNRKLFSGEKF